MAITFRDLQRISSKFNQKDRNQAFGELSTIKHFVNVVTSRVMFILVSSIKVFEYFEK